MIDRLSVHPYDLADLSMPASRRRFDFMVFAPAETMVVLGKSNRPEDEVIARSVLADRVRIVRRPSGGQAVVLTPRTAVVSFYEAGRHSLGRHGVFERFCGILVNALDLLGVSGIKKEGISDLALGGKKFTGSSVYLNTGYAFFHAVVNLAEDPKTIARYLKQPPRMPDYRRGRRHTDFVTSLADEGYSITAHEIRRAVTGAVGGPFFFPSSHLAVK